MVNAWVKETRQAKKRKTKKWSELALFVENGETGRILQKVTHWSLNDLGEKKKQAKKTPSISEKIIIGKIFFPSIFPLI